MAENWNGVTVKFQLLPVATRRPGKNMTTSVPKFIVAHDTGNLNSTAQNNVDYYRNTYNIDWDYVASAHIFVDDKEAIICIPTTEIAYHVIYNAPTDNLWYNLDANDAAIGVEGCYFSDKERTKKSLDNFARVLAYLCDYWKIDYKTRMPGHQDIQSDKQDPGNLLQQAGYSRATSNLDKIVAKYIKGSKSVKSGSVTPKVKHTDYKTAWNLSGIFYPNTTIKVRKSPGLDGAVVDKNSWLYTKNDWVPFDKVIKKDGFWWIRFKYQQPGSSKDYYYCAVCKITDKHERIVKEKYWGQIKWK